MSIPTLPYYHNIDLRSNELIRARFYNLTTTARLALTLTTTDAGFPVYDKTALALYIWNGTSWTSGSGGGGITSISAGTGMSFTTITTSGSVNIDTTKVPYFASGFSTGFLKYNGSAWIFDTASYEPAITAGTTGQYYRGDKTFQTLDKTAVGLSNVDNTTDAGKPVSTAQATAIALKEDSANKSTSTGDSASSTKFPVWSVILSYFDISRIKTILGISTLSGSNTGDQTITLTGDVTGSGTGTFGATIASASVSLSKMSALAANSIIGNNTGSSTTPIALTVAQVKALLAISLTSDVTGTLQATQFPALTGDVTTSAGSLVTTIAAASVTLAKQANLAANSIIGNNTGSSATPIALTVAQVKALLAISLTTDVTGVLQAAQHPALTGDVTNSAGSLATTIAAGAVTLAKQANLAANSIQGNNTGSSATPLALTATQVTAMLNVFSSTLNGLVPLSGGGTTNFLRADGTWAAAGGGGSLSSLTVATATNTINNVSYQQEWQWNSLAGSSGLKLSATSTAAASNIQKLFEIDLNGANATGSQTTYGAYISNTHTGSGSTNVALYLNASGGANNTALSITNGLVMIGSSPAQSSGSQVVISCANVSSLNILTLQNNGSDRFTFSNTTGYTQIAGGNSNQSTAQTTFSVQITGGISITSEAVPVKFTHPSNFTITGSYSLQRICTFGQGTITAASALTVTTAVTMEISGPTIASGSALITTSIGFRIAAGSSLGSGVTYGVALYAVAPTGATNNYAALFTGGNVGIGTTTPTGLLHLGAGTVSIPPFVLTTGTVNTTETPGAYEYNGSHYETPVSRLRYGKGGCIFNSFSDVGNSGTTETDLHSYTTVANTFSTNGESISANYGGTFIGSSGTATRQLKLYFAGTVIFDSTGLLITGDSSWTLTILIMRVSSSVIRYMIYMNSPLAPVAVYTVAGELTGLTLSGSNILKVTTKAGGVGAATNDVVLKIAVGNWLACANN